MHEISKPKQENKYSKLSIERNYAKEYKEKASEG